MPLFHIEINYLLSIKRIISYDFTSNYYTFVFMHLLFGGVQIKCNIIIDILKLNNKLIE